MGLSMPILTPEIVYRQYVTDGVPGSGEHDPIKSEIVQLLNQFFGTANGSFVVVETKAALDAVTPDEETWGGVVLNDPDATKNGYYYRDAAAWVKGRGFPDTFAVLESIGGTANAITASTSAGVNPGDIQCLLLPDPSGTNTSATVTIALNGGAPESVKNAAGGSVAIGDIIDGVGTLFFRVGSEWRQLFSSETGATFDHQGDYDNGATYTENQVVTGSDGKWYQLKVASATGDNPVSGGSGDWFQILSPGGVADGGVTEPKLASTLTDNMVYVAADRTALKAVDTARYTTALLAEAGRRGTFLWDSSDLSATLVGSDIDSSAVDSGTDTITSVAHGLLTGQPVITTTAVNGLALNTVYYVIRVDDDDYRLASSFANAAAGTAFDLTGTDAVTVNRHYDPAEGVFVCPTADLSGASGAWVRLYGDMVCPEWCGAARDGATDDTKAILDAVVLQQLLSDASRVLLGKGTYLVSVFLGVNALLIEDPTDLTIEGAGMGATTIFQKASSPGMLLSVKGATDFSLKGVTLDGNRANQASSGHCLRGENLDGFFITEVECKNAYSYGIGLQDDSILRAVFRTIYIHDVGADGIDVKNKDDGSTQNDLCIIDGIWVENWGLRGDLTTQAAIDIRGPFRISNVDIRDPGADDAVGIRLRFGELNDGANGPGGHFSTLTNFRIEMGVSGTTTQQGINNGARDVQVSNGSISAGQIGVVGENVTGARRPSYSNVTVSSCSAHGFKISTDSAMLTGCMAAGCGLRGFEIEARWVTGSGLAGIECDEGIRFTADAERCIITGILIRESGTRSYNFSTGATKIQVDGAVLTGTNAAGLNNGTSCTVSDVTSG